MRILFSLLALVLTSATFGQKVKEPVDSKTLLLEGFNELNEDRYNKSIDLFNQIPRSDTNYVLGQLNACIALFLKEEYTKVNELAEKQLFDASTYQEDFYEWWIKSLIKQKEWDKVEATINKATEEYPLFHQFEILRGISLKEQERYEEAKLHFQKIIKHHVFSDQAHYELALLAAEEGHIVRALISMEFAITINNSMKNIQKAYQTVYDICENKYKAERKVENPSEGVFKEIFELIESEIALKPKYKSDLDYNFSVVRQTDLLIKSIEYKENTDDFWMDFYVPYLIKVQKQKLIPGYTLSFLKVLSGASDIQTLVGKNDKNISATTDLTVDYFLDYIKKTKYPINGVTYDQDYLYNGNSNLIGVGDLKNDKRDGKWIYFHSNGKISAELTYENSNLVDYNKWYDEKGNVTKYYTLKDDKIEGEALFPYDNGLPYIKGQYKKGEFDGLLKQYYYNGLLKETFTMKAGDKEGPYYQFSYSGDTIVRAMYEKDMLEGKYYDYYINGDIYYETEYKKGQKNGKYKRYYRNGQVSIEGQYQNGKEVGKWINYYDNGQVELTYTVTENGKADGVFIEYTFNGDTSRLGELKKGQLHGLEKNYTSEGRLYSKIMYKKGNMKSYQYFDSLGNVISEGKKYLICYDKYGYKYFEGNVKGKHGRDGEWIYYWKNGLPETKKTYTKGVLNGPVSWYYFSGELKGKSTYKDDELNGYYATYHENGKMEKEGWYIDGEKEGDWYEYTIHGKLKNHSFYQEGDFTGYYMEYSQNGKLHAESYYENDLLQRVSFFDSTGAKINTVSFNQGSGDYTTNAVVKGNPFIKGEMSHGERNGMFKFMYTNNKPEVETNYLYGVKEGLYKNYHFNGKLYETGSYERGYKQGVWETYFLNGNKRAVYIYNYDVLNDSSVHYFENGAISSIRHYDSEGEKHGIEYDYYDNGQIETATPYQHGFKHGEYVYYNKEGLPIYKKFYNGSILLGYSYMKDDEWVKMIPITKNTKVVAYYPNGQKSIEYTLKNNNYEGEYKRYHSNGELWTVQDHDKDELNGKYEFYNPEGKAKTIGNYYYGYKNGNFKYYDDNGVIDEDLNYYYGKVHGVCKYYVKGKLAYTVTYYQGNVIDIINH